MCYFLTIGSPLTLSEVRAMLPAGIGAHPVSGAEAAGVRRLLPAALTVATLVVGGCSCDLVRTRAADQREDERHLRERFARLRLPRGEIIRRLERHRRRPREEPADPAGDLAAFVWEHARNAGPTLYLLRFGEPTPGHDAAMASPVTRSLADVRSRPNGWLEEERAVLVVR